MIQLEPRHFPKKFFQHSSFRTVQTTSVKAISGLFAAGAADLSEGG